MAAAMICALPSLAAATPSMLFSQSAGVATSRAAGANVADVTLRTAHRSVLAFEDRPGRRTATLPEHKFLGLWRTAFRGDPPNAVLSGRDDQGRNRRVVVTVTGAARTAYGVRYRMRALRSVIPARMTTANLAVDDVPLSAIAAYLAQQGARATRYEALINALQFPSVVQPVAMPTLTVDRGLTATLGQQVSAPTVITLGSVTIAPGATLFLQGFTTIRANSLTLGAGARILMPGSPTLFSLTATGLPACAPPDAFTWTGTLTQVRSAGGMAGVGLTQPPTQPWPASSVSAGGGPGGCVVTWGFNPPPRITAMPAWFPGGMTIITTTSSTEQVAAVSGSGSFTASNVVLTVHSQPVTSP